MTRNTRSPHFRRSLAIVGSTALLAAGFLLGVAGAASADTPPAGAVVDQSNVANQDCVFTPITGQTFTAGQTGTLTSIDVTIWRTESGGTIDFYATSGGLPTGPVVATATYPAQTVVGHVSADYTLNLDGAGLPVVSGTQYAFAIPANFDFGCTDGTGGHSYAGGNTADFDGTTWTVSPFPADDLAFTTYVVPLAAPVASPVSVSASEDSATPVPLSTTGTVDSVAVSTAPGHGTATVSGTAISYTPAAGYVGPDTFEYTATNTAGTSTPALVTVAVAAPVVTLSETTVKAGDSLTVSGTDFPASASFDVVLHSAPITLATVTTSATGAFSVAVTIPATVAPGAHSIVVGSVIRPVALTVTAAPTLAATGSTDGEWLTPTAVILLLLGSLGLAFGYRRRGAGHEPSEAPAIV